MASDARPTSPGHEVTELLRSWRQGDTAALDQLVPLVHAELRRVARSHVRREGLGHTLQATALVHEVYLRLVGIDRLTLNDRTHFFAVAARLMRQILVDHARRKRATKRGGAVTMIGLDEISPASQTSIVDVIALDQALDALSARDARQGRVVELRFFAGLSIDETAEASIADRFYAQLEVGDLGRAHEAMVRLVRRALSRGSDPELFAALVPACRYCGLLRHSVAAHERGARLDPNIRTSVQHTFFMLGDYLRAADEGERSWAPGNAWGLSLACAGHPDARRALEVEGERYANTPFGPKAMNVINPDPGLLRAAVDELVASGFRDPEGLFYQVIKLAHAGETDRAVEILSDVVGRGFYPYETFMRHAWLDSLRVRQDFNAILELARHNYEKAHAAFVTAGGKTLLGVEG